MILKFLDRFSSKIKVMKLAKIIGINEHFFLDLLIYNLSKVFRAKIDENLIILGGNYGKFYGGNTKYLYKYLKENTDYKLIWISKSRELNKQLERQGIKTVYAYTLKAIKLLRRAKAVFVTHGFVDVLPIDFSPKTLFIQTWHGGDIKIIGSSPYFDKYIYSKWTRLLRVKLRNHQLYDFVVSTSDKERPLKILAEAFNYPVERIITTGYPRNDILFSQDKNLKNNLRLKYNIPGEIERIILYAPTFRPDFIAKFPINQKDLSVLDQLLLNTKTLFLMKAHIKEKLIEFKDLKRIKTIGIDSDTQELLYITDILITDYSSVYCDFLLLNKPIILFTYDYDKYVEEWGLFYDTLEEIAPGPLVYTEKELIDAIKNIAKIEKDYESKRLELRDYFNKYADGESSERLLKFLKLIK